MHSEQIFPRVSLQVHSHRVNGQLPGIIHGHSQAGTPQTQHSVWGASERSTSASHPPPGSDVGQANEPSTTQFRMWIFRQETWNQLLILGLTTSSSPDGTVAGFSQKVPQDVVTAQQELHKQVAANLELKVEEIPNPADSLFDMGLWQPTAKVALPIHDVVVRIMADPILLATYVQEGRVQVLHPLQKSSRACMCALTPGHYPLSLPTNTTSRVNPAQPSRTKM